MHPKSQVIERTCMSPMRHVTGNRAHLHVADAHPGAAPDVGRHRHLASLPAHAELQQLARCRKPPAAAVSHCDVAGVHGAVAAARVDARAGD